MENLVLHLTGYFSAGTKYLSIWGKKIIKLEVHAEVRLGMNLFLFCLHLAVPSTFRPKLPPERGQRSGFKDVWAAFA